MSLTEAGRIFYAQCREITDAVQRAEASVAEASATPRGTLEVTAPLGLGRRVVSKITTGYRERHPEMDVHLRLTDQLLDLVHESVDVAIRMTHHKDSIYTLRKVAQIERVLCAAPSYLERRGAPNSPADLLDHHCLLHRLQGAEHSRWTLLIDGSRQVVKVSGKVDADDTEVLLDWAVDGQGIVMMPLFEVAALIADGALAPILEATPPTPVTLGILFPTRKMLPQRTKSFVDLAVEVLREHIGNELRKIGKGL